MAYGRSSIETMFPHGLTVIGSADRISLSAAYDEYDPRELGHVQNLILFLHVISADRTDADETYDLYVTSRITDPSGAKVLEWDLAHFPQIASTGEKVFSAVIQNNSGIGGPNRVTTAVPGVSSLESATMKIDTAGSDQGVKTLAAGTVRHGCIGQQLGWYLVTGGSTPGPIVFSLFAHTHGGSPK
jgi:hypothetical protein